MEFISTNNYIHTCWNVKADGSLNDVLRSFHARNTISQIFANRSKEITTADDVRTRAYDSQNYFKLLINQLILINQIVQFFVARSKQQQQQKMRRTR